MKLGGLLPAGGRVQWLKKNGPGLVVSTTQRYMHLDDQELADAQDLVE